MTCVGELRERFPRRAARRAADGRRHPHALGRRRTSCTDVLRVPQDGGDVSRTARCGTSPASTSGCARPPRGSRRATSPSCTTCSRTSATPTCASRCRCGRAAVACPPSPTCGRPPTGTSARCGTCSASASTAIPTCAASSCRRGGRAIRCARSIRRAARSSAPS